MAGDCRSLAFQGILRFLLSVQTPSPRGGNLGCLSLSWKTVAPPSWSPLNPQKNIRLLLCLISMKCSLCVCVQLKVRCGDSFRSTKGSPDRTVMKVCKNNILTISKRVSNVLASLYKNITDATGKKMLVKGKFLISLLLFHFFGDSGRSLWLWSENCWKELN